MLVQATSYVNGNEKAYSLQEFHEQSPSSSGFHRYRVIMVNRDGKLAEFREDMGLAKKWRGIKQFNIPALFLHTVDELLDMGVDIRNNTYIDVKDWLGLENYKAA